MMPMYNFGDITTLYRGNFVYYFVLREHFNVWTANLFFNFTSNCPAFVEALLVIISYFYSFELELMFDFVK